MRDQLLNVIDRYLTGAIPLRDLESWLVGNLQAILATGDAETIHVANQVDADLMELGEGLITERTVRDRLQRHRRHRLSSSGPLLRFDAVITDHA